MSDSFENNTRPTELSPGIRIRPAAASDGAAIRSVVFGVLEEYGLRPDVDGIDSDLDDVFKSYIARGGIFEVIEDSRRRIAGTVGLFPMSESEIELRKMYFLPEIRGKGLGKKTLQRMIDTARDLGYERILLETASVLKEAIGLYRSFGFKEDAGIHSDRCDKAFSLDILT